MKKRIIYVICCLILPAILMTGCFPFNIAQNIMQNNQLSTIGGADGPTSVVVTTPSSEIESESNAVQDPSEAFGDNLNSFTSFNDTHNTIQDAIQDMYNSDSPILTFYEHYYANSEYDDFFDIEFWNTDSNYDVEWMLFEGLALLYSDDDNGDYLFAEYEVFYDQDAINYIANDLAEYGLTEEEQLAGIDYMPEHDHYYCIVFSNIKVYENDTYVGEYEKEFLPYVGYEQTDDFIIRHEVLNMNTREQESYYTVIEESPNANPPSEDIQRIGNENVGYVDVPSDYITFVDPSLSTTDMETLQYGDLTATNIVTLTYFENIPADDKELANATAEQFKISGMDPDTVTCESAVIDYSVGYKVYGYYPDEDTHVTVWILDSHYDSHILHYIGVEYDSDHTDLCTMVENTYHVMD